MRNYYYYFFFIIIILLEFILINFENYFFSFADDINIVGDFVYVVGSQMKTDEELDEVLFKYFR